jgi:xeroderma pigmentosum group C-complementing protein
LVNDLEDEGEDAEEGMSLYAEYQTSFYQPPPMADGQIPKNAYGNLDVYVPSMIPAGAAHIRHPLAAQAAKVLGINFVEAVTGFEFKGRQGTAVIDGVVVDIDMCNAMVNVIEGLESQASEEIEAQRRRIVLGMWKKWLVALRVRERVHRDYGDKDVTGPTAVDDDANSDEYEDAGGGFMPEASESIGPVTDQAIPPAFPNLRPIGQLLPPEVVHRDVIIVRSPNSLPRELKSTLGKDFPDMDSSKEEAGGFFSESEQETARERDIEQQAGTVIWGAMDNGNSEFEAGGGFLPEDEETLEGGGFLPDTADDVNASSQDQSRRVISFNDGNLDDNAGGFMPDSSTTIIGDTSASLSAKVHPVDDIIAPAPSEGDRVAAVSATGVAGGIVSSRDISAHGALLESPPPQLAPSGTVPQPEAKTSPVSTASLQSETSLLSHDPDEEDAEPEWLLNSLGELD